MCYKSPGPRCSAHAKKRFILLKHKRSDMMKSGTASWEEQAELEEEIKAAEMDFDSTPVGMARLELRRSQGMDYDGVISERIENCKELRRLQLKAIKSKERGDLMNHDGNPAAVWAGSSTFLSVEQPRVPFSSDENRNRRDSYFAVAEQFSQSLSTDEAKTVYWFTSDGSTVLNSHLNRAGAEADPKWTYEKKRYPSDESYSKKEIKEAISHMDGIFERHVLPSPIITYRGLGNNMPDQLGANEGPGSPELLAYVKEKYPVGENITVPGYMSTSVDPEMAHRFSGYESVIMEIKTRKALPIGFFSAWNDSEREYITNRNAEYKVIAVQENVTYENVYSSPKKDMDTANRKVTVIQLEEI